MPMLPIPPYRPDLSDYEGAATQTLLNVMPRGDGYGPFPDFTVFTAALPAACRGFFYARKADGSVAVFAGTSTKLYQLNNTSFAWTDVSKSGGSYSALPNSDQWQFAQFNNFVFAVQINSAVQVFDLTSSSAFADLGGSPPPARYIAVVGRFLVLSGLGSSTPYRIQWSGLNATTTWTAGVNQSDFQDFPDGGVVRGVAGGEYGIVFQDASIRRLTYAPGSPVVFQIDRISEEKGIFAPLSIVRAGDRVFYISPDGFQMIAPGGYPQPIGKERVDRTFFADVDTANLQLCIGASDPKGSRVYWAYKSLAGSSGLFDKILCYDSALDRWSPIAMTGEYLTTLAKPGATLESLDSISGSLDALSFSLDDVSTASLAQCRRSIAPTSSASSPAPTSRRRWSPPRRAATGGASSCVASVPSPTPRPSTARCRRARPRRPRRPTAARPWSTPSACVRSASPPATRAARCGFRPAPAGLTRSASSPTW
jgi:hypothetical protein